MSKSNSIIKKSFFSLALLAVLLMPLASLAQSRLALTVTPPLFQITLHPGAEWSSNLKVVNTNNFELVIYASVFGFAPQGDRGQGRFISTEGMSEEDLSHILPGWIDVVDEPIVIPPGKTGTVPFSLSVPEDASPGGHYATILVGTRPPDEGEGSQIKVSTLISSILFVRVSGDVVEEGSIRSFLSKKNIHTIPEVDFELRFENTGNVHLRPQGEVTVFNMWGKERGHLPINQKTDFGNVLPNSVRRFDFSWKGENNFFEVGRYTAVATLNFGDSGKQNVHRETSFWVIPLQATLSVLGGIVFIVLLLAWAIKAYVRRALAMHQQALQNLGVDLAHENELQDTSAHEEKPGLSVGVLTRPITEGIVDLRNVAGRRGQEVDTSKVTSASPVFFKKYGKFFVFVFLAIPAITISAYYFQAVLQKERSFDVTVQRGADEVTLSSEELILEELEAEQRGSEPPGLVVVEPDNSITISIFNGGGVPGAAAEASLALEQAGYQIEEIGNMDSFEQDESIIKFHSEQKEFAEKIRNVLNRKFILQEEDVDPREMIVIILGKN